jgi:hypothetical protein
LTLGRNVILPGRNTQRHVYAFFTVVRRSLGRISTVITFNYRRCPPHVDRAPVTLVTTPSADRYMQNKSLLLMRSLLSFLFTLALYLVLLSGCEDGNENAPKPTPDATRLHFFINNNVAENTQFHSMDAEAGGSLFCEKGTVLQFPENAFSDLEGNLITGQVDIKLIEIFDRSAMVLMRKPTMGRDTDGALSALKSGGQFYIEAKQGSKLLIPAKPYAIIAPVDHTGGADENMRLFTGIEDCENNLCNVIWEEDADERNVPIDGFQVTGGFYNAYYAFRNNFGWTNIDRWYNDPRPKTTVHVKAPAGFDNTNSAVFMAYKGEPSTLAMFDKFETGTDLFTEHYGMIPIGLEVHFILVSIIEDEIHYAIQSATIKENHIEKMSEVKMISKAALIELIDGLD